MESSWVRWGGGEAMACFIAGPVSPAYLLEPPARGHLHGPKGAQRNHPALHCPIKNQQIKSSPPCQDVLIALTGGLSPPFTACRPEKKREPQWGDRVGALWA